MNNLLPTLPAVWHSPTGDFEQEVPVDIAGYVADLSYEPDTFESQRYIRPLEALATTSSRDLGL